MESAQNSKSSHASEGGKQNVNCKRGAALFSPTMTSQCSESREGIGPIGLTDLNLSSYHGMAVKRPNADTAGAHKVSLSHIDERLIASSPSHARPATAVGGNVLSAQQSVRPQQILPGEIENQPPASSTMAEPPDLNTTVNTCQQDGGFDAESEKSKCNRTMAEIASDGEWKEVIRSRKPRSRNMLMPQGKLGKASPVLDGKFRAAENKKINIRNKRKDHNAYKLYVSRFKLEIFLDEKVWPEGIVFRRFVHFRPQGTDGRKCEGGVNPEGAKQNVK
ncbi:hypothetical protein O0L34_g13467 [Tuta absoluta]|nr:hypothetical protein O0L34_g13467 [Tuta absoluta]